MQSPIENGGPLEQRLREDCYELEKRLQAGENCRAEMFFEKSPELASGDDAILELVYLEFVLRKEMGQEPSREDFYRRFPNLRESLERQFQIHDLMEEGK